MRWLHGRATGAAATEASRRPRDRHRCRLGPWQQMFIDPNVKVGNGEGGALRNPTSRTTPGITGAIAKTA